MTILLFCYHVLNDSTGHTKHENLPECGRYKAKYGMHVTTDITPRAT